MQEICYHKQKQITGWSIFLKWLSIYVSNIDHFKTGQTHMEDTLKKKGRKGLKRKLDLLNWNKISSTLNNLWTVLAGAEQAEHCWADQSAEENFWTAMLRVTVYMEVN